MGQIQHIGILTSGGDAPGMNAAVRAATLVALSRGCKVSGVERGYRGLIDGRFRALSPGDVTGIIREGGTILGSARAPEFAEVAVRHQARAQLADAGIEGLVVIGGNGSLTGALALADAEEAARCGGASAPAVVGSPASIDNDMGLSQLSIGVDTAMNTIVEACDKLADTASAHHRAFLVEVMGRASGYLAMTAGVATGANAVFFRESGQTEAQLVDALEKAVVQAGQRTDRPKRVLAIKAEGVEVPTERLKEQLDARLRARGDSAMDTRMSILGHVVRGGRPSAFDRLLASRMGHVAARSLLDGGNTLMTGWMSEGASAEVGQRSPYDPHVWLVDLKTALEETARLLSGESEHVKWRVKIFRELEDVLAL